MDSLTGQDMSLSDWSKYDRPAKFGIHGSFVTGQNITESKSQLRQNLWPCYAKELIAEWDGEKLKET